MPFILSEQRDKDCESAFKAYEHYLSENRTRFPRGTRALIDSDWYFTFARHAPHDAWLKELQLTESELGEDGHSRKVSLLIRLLGSYHDGEIVIRYPQVYSYSFAATNVANGHADWRYDEFRLSEEGRLIHEIEWWGKETGRWIIEADDIEYSWKPFEVK